MNNMPPRPRGGALQLRPTKAPGEPYLFGNYVAVSPEDIPQNRDRSDPYVLLNGQYVFSARPLQGFPPGQISLSDPQRTTAKVALTDVVTVEPYDPFSRGGNVYLLSIDVGLSFAGKKTTEEQLDQDVLAQQVVQLFENQMFQAGQQFLLDYRSIPFKLEVKTTEVGGLMGDIMSEKQSAPFKNQRGILTRQTAINFFRDTRGAAPVNIAASNRRPAANAIIQPDFKFEDMGIGGLDKEFSKIFRRAFASRIFPPGIINKLGITHVKGILLYGPPGTGKTLIARKIGQMLNAREPKVINGPEVLNKYVGQSEENIRKLFADAEKEYKEKGEESGLHIIIFDELDAVCKQRGSGGAGGTGVGDSVVNQLLSKLDGVDQLNNILLIGMTNRMDMIDDALLRPGRLELHVEISLPDEDGRVQILNIHTEKMRTNQLMGSDVNIAQLAAETKNFSGAEISGLVRSATSFAFNRHTKGGSMAGIKEDVASLKVTMQDFMNALSEVTPAFGVAEESLSNCIPLGILPYSPNVNEILKKGAVYVDSIRQSAEINVRSVLVYGPPGSGKTALAAKIALDSQFSFIRLISAADLIGYGEPAKIQYINKIFNDAYKSTLSVIVIDAIEEVIDWSPIGPRFNNILVGVLSTLLSKQPPEGRRLLILATTSEQTIMRQLNLTRKFQNMIPVPYLHTREELASALHLRKAFGGDRQAQQEAVARVFENNDNVGVGIKNVLFQAESAMRSADPVGVFADEMAMAGSVEEI